MIISIEMTAGDAQERFRRRGRPMRVRGKGARRSYLDVIEIRRDGTHRVTIVSTMDTINLSPSDLVEVEA